MDRQEWDALYEQVKALEAKFAEQAARPRAPAAAPPARTPPPVLRREAVALWRIAMVCKDALRNRALPLEARPYFVQIAEVCRAVAHRKKEGQGGSAGV